MSLLPLLQQNIFTIRSVFSAAHAIKNKVSVTEAYVIVLLFERPLTRRELFDTIKRDRSTTQHVLKELKDKHLVTETPEQTFSLTHIGVKIYSEIIAAIVDSCKK
jgi:predicted transcriptional regulator